MSPPCWQGWTREALPALGKRAGAFIDWLQERPETHVAIASHSAFLLATFNAALEVEEESARQWFGTGEMRSVLLTPASTKRKRADDHANAAAADGEGQ